MGALDIVKNISPAPRRSYYKCGDCLSAVVLDDTGINGRETLGLWSDRPCACGGKLAFMGKVRIDQRTWERTGYACKCDERCVDARGPNCSCACGGVNHGAGMEGYVEVVKETGRATVRPPDKKAFVRAGEYRAAKEAAYMRIEAKWGDDLAAYRTRGRWLPRSVWAGIKADLSAWRHAAGLKVHSLRLKALDEI